MDIRVVTSIQEGQSIGGFGEGILLITGLIVCVFGTGCGRVTKPLEKYPEPTPSAKAVRELKLASKDSVADRSGNFAVFKFSNPVSVDSRLTIHFEIEEIKTHKSLGRELMIVPMENGREIPEEWPHEGPQPVTGDSIGDVSLSKTDLDSAIGRCKNYSNLNSRPNVRFMLRVIYSDSVRASRNTVLTIEIPLT